MFDLFNISIISAFAFIGFYRGLVREAVGLFIFIIAVVTALHFSIPIDFIISKSLPFPLFSTIISHAIVFMTVLAMAKLFFLKALLQHVKFFSVGADGVFGAIFGAIKGLMASLLIFSCLHISGAGHALAINKTWFYSLDHSIYNKLAVFVTNNEIITLGKIKHVQNYEPEEVESFDLKDETVNENHNEDKAHTTNLDNILSVIYEGGKLLDDTDYQLIVDAASSLSVMEINYIFDLCCKDLKSVKEKLKLDDDKLSIYIASLIMNNYKKDNILSETQDYLIKKIDNILSKTKEPQIIIEDKPIANKKNVNKISNDIDVSIPIPVKNPNYKIIKKPQTKEKTLPTVNKIKAIPKPIHKPILLVKETKIPDIKSKNEYTESDDLRNDINSLIEESIMK
jgi:uncharacterized membrane protein required for colicin V production